MRENAPAADNESELEIDLGEIDWSSLPEEYADAAAPAAAAPATAAPPRPEAGASAPAGLPASFHPAFADIVSRVEPEGLRPLIASTFARLLRVLDTLAVIEQGLTRPTTVKVGSLFEEVRTQTVLLLSQVTGAVSGDAGLDPRLRDVLDGMRFVIGHELTKVFRQEFPGLTQEGPSRLTRADLCRAWGLLHNCLQQTAITLAQAFAPGVTGEQLFEDYKCKVENSFTLYRELQGLLRRVRAAERSNGIQLKHTLVRHLEHFRDETMHLLMYKDWGEFGRHVDDVRRAFEEMEEFESALRGFSQYLETLTRHVGRREALRDLPLLAGDDAPAA